ncbi:hypothetical protein [Pedobacter sp. MR2016-24]|uniref:hypothetical protein n=1 Tax=Pedobacter sp. MR2016-24 TaxID=2994466 RepID=UPI0022466D0C|nr:hypothetical protein [Pedobacter sp. MR2016-24]MCX2482107.1 hypothetical protein [Pedobacter sp. MR2016-24]
MDKKFNYLAFALLFMTMSFGCKKETNNGSDLENQVVSINKSDDDKVLKFLSISLGIDKQEIVTSGKNYIIREHKFNRDSVQAQYDRANEYKLKYETAQ